MNTHRVLLAITLLLTGCFSWSEPETASSEVGTPIDTYADKNDLVMSRAAAAVEVAKVANDKGNKGVVRDELNVASTYLPRPTVEDLEYAKNRAASANAEDYKKAIEVADRHQRELDDVWAAVEREKQKAKEAVEAKVREHEAERKMFVTYVVAGVGGLGVLAGIAMLLLGFSRINSIISIAAGLCVVAAATVFDSPWFGWVAAVTIILSVIETWRRLSSHRQAQACKAD